MIISPNTIFEQYISNVLPELGEDNVISVVFEDILKMLLKGRKIQSKNDFLEKNNCSLTIQKKFIKTVSSLKRQNFLGKY